MKKIFTIAIVAMTCAVMMTACNSNKFKKAENGLLYRIETSVPDGDQPQVGDLLVGEITLMFEEDTLFSNVGHPDRIAQVTGQNMFKGDIQEGFQLMHKGEKAIFKVPADSMSKFIPQMPEQYKPGTNQFFYYQISLMDIVSKDDLAQEQANREAEAKERQEHEAEYIAEYVAKNNITAKPNKDGLYIIVNKKGNGPKVETGKKVAIDYTGRLIDGSLFDTSREADAKEANKYVEGRNYEPLSYVVGQQPLIKGWEDGVKGQTAGSEITLIIPSALGYGARGAGNDIMPYSPLVFNLTIVSVE